MKWRKHLLLVMIVFFYTVAFLQAQPQNNNWFFSQGNGLNFSAGAPVTAGGGRITAMEGAASISDKLGRLLFYSDGVTVWNKNHAVMVNGLGLSGGFGSSTQACLIVPKTRDEKQYYIFTTDDEGGMRGFQYSVVDLNLDNGLGAVTLKNQQLVTPCTEKVTAIRHCNKKDYWVITHRFGSDAFYAYLATENGVDPNPVISHTGSFIPTEYYVMAGALKGSPDGKKILAMQNSIGVELSDFNNQTGVVSNTVEIYGNSNAHHYGAEFSASSKKLYVGIHGYWYQPDLERYSAIVQFDLSSPVPQDIINSKFEVFRHLPLNAGNILQRGPDGKIYISMFERAYLSVINDPEVSGAGCNFTERGFILPSIATSLPNLLNDFSTSVDSFRVSSTGTCVNIPVNFDYTVSGDVTSLAWNFGDPASGPLNTSSLVSPVHTFTSTGTYTIKLIKYSPCGNDTLSQQINVGDIQVNLGSDTTICENTNYVLTPQTTNTTNYLWQDGSTAPVLTASSPGIYWLQVSNTANGCIRRDSMLITTKPLPVINLGVDTALCIGTTLQLNAFNAGAQYNWQDNSNQPDFIVSTAGNYWVEVNLNGCRKTDSIRIGSLDKPRFSLGADQQLCPGLSLILSPGLNNVTYLWQDGTTDNTKEVRSTGLYFVDITNSCGTTRDSITVSTGNCTVYVPSAFTPNGDGINDRFRILGTDLVKDFEWKIFDRNGQVLFQTRDKTSSWDGMFKSAKLPSGVYVYMITYNEVNQMEKKLIKGTVLLVR